jgi:hypothetical protein
MGLAGGMFNIIRQGQASASAFARPPASNSATSGSTNPQSWTLKRNESAIDAFWRLAPVQAARSKMMTPATMQRLQKLAESDNKDISAEKMRQAKAKLDGLRRQLQMLAATGDVRQLRRIAAEAASLAREIGAAARALSQGIGAQGIGSSQMPSDAGSAQAVANAANGAAQTAPAASAQAETESGAQVEGDAQAPGDAQAQSTTIAETIKGGSAVAQFKELNELSNDARNAIVQAKGIIALAAQMARAKRRGADDEDDRYFRDLQEQADAALAEVDRGQREATSALLGESGETAAEGVSTVTSVTLETSITAFVFTQTQIDVYA